MRLNPLRVEATMSSPAGGSAVAAPLVSATGSVLLGPLEVRVELDGAAQSISSVSQLAWSVANRGDSAVQVRAVSVVFGLVGAEEPVRIFRNGYQSWSPTGVATFGIDVDPSTLADFEFMQACHHADQRRALDGELRSEWLTLLADAGTGVDRPPLLVGFDGGDEHDGTLRLRTGAGGIELWAEAFLGDVTLAAGEQRTLHSLVIDERPVDESTKLDAWAQTVGHRHSARVSAGYQVGWCSWYQYFHGITEQHLRRNLALAADWPFEVFQLDDGYQSAIGDWRTTNDKFPSDLEGIAAAIAAEGRRPGIWLAPFLAAPDSQVATRNPGWLARFQRDGTDHGPLRAWWNLPWGGGDDGFMYGLDTTNPEVLDHLESLAADLVSAGFTYLKLDFTFAPSVEGGWNDPGMTPAQRVRAGYDAIRRGAGDDSFILGCGVPLSNVVGVVDANRIGQDVAPNWEPEQETITGYGGTEPATQSALASTMNRAFMHRRLWLNDPDCLMLRTTDTDLTIEQVRTWAHAVGLSGGMALVSDDLQLLDDASRRLLSEVVALGRASDAAIVAGNPAVSSDLMDHTLPARFESASHRLMVDPVTGTSTLTPK